MNLSIRTAIGSAIHRADELCGSMKSNLELTQELTDAVESLGMAKQTGHALLAMLDELEVARQSLDKCGYSDQWLNTINVEGKFLDAVNFDMVKLVGSKEEKTTAAMEGIWSTIWSYIKKIWDFIIDILGKVVNFIKTLFGISRADISEADKLRAMIKMCLGKKDPEKIAQRFGEAINQLNGGKAYDMRELIVRMNALHGLAWVLCTSICPSCGTSSPDSKTGEGFFDDAFVDYAVGASDNSKNSTASKTNKIFKDVLKKIENDPTSVVGSNNLVSGFDGMRPLQSSNLKQAMETSGISMYYEGDQINIKIDQIPGKIHEIDYCSLYRLPNDYITVSECFIRALKLMYTPMPGVGVSSKALDANVKTIKGYAEQARIFATAHEKNIFGMHAVDHKRSHDAFACFSRWVLETTTAITSMINAFNVTRNEGVKINRVLMRVAREVAAEKKED